MRAAARRTRLRPATSRSARPARTPLEAEGGGSARRRAIALVAGLAVYAGVPWHGGPGVAGWLAWAHQSYPGATGWARTVTPPAASAPTRGHTRTLGEGPAPLHHVTGATGPSGETCKPAVWSRLVTRHLRGLGLVPSSKGVQAVATRDAGRQYSAAMCNRTPPVGGVDSPTTYPGRRLARGGHADRARRAGPGPWHT